MTTLERTSYKQLSAILFFLTSLLGTLFLFYIDEGNYNFNNLFKLGNLIPLSVYMIGIYLAHYGFYYLLKKKVSTLPSLILTCLLAYPIGSLMIAGVFIGMRVVLM